MTSLHKLKREETKLNEREPIGVSEPIPYDNIVRVELWNEIHRFLETLPSGFAEVIRLYYIEGKGIREMAAIPDIPVYTVKSRRARGIQRLQKILPGYFTFQSLLLIFSNCA